MMISFRMAAKPVRCLRIADAVEGSWNEVGRKQLNGGSWNEVGR